MRRKKIVQYSMREVLKLVSVEDYSEFKKRVIERTHWTRTQYNDRKIGRIQISYIDREVLLEIAEQLRKEGVDR